MVEGNIMNIIKSSAILASSVAGMMLSLTAHSAVIECSEAPRNASLNYMAIEDTQVTACLDSGVGTLAGTGSNADFLNENPTLGYEFVSKWDIDDNKTTGVNVGLSFTQTDDNTALGDRNGGWSFDESFWDDYSDAAIGFKFGTGETPDEWFVFSLTPGVFSGSWAFFRGEEINTGGGLSHINLYTKNDTVTVPEPGTLALLGLGIVGLTVARKRKASA
jgi:hypothetical protein